ncbi:MAG: HAD family phosphatase [Bacteroidetes bacterium]|nr:HAD family phosphatase [Bacteroidota bacterium]
MGRIKNIIFDLGGVILNIDYQETINAFKKLGFSRFDEMYSALKVNNTFDDLETGKISEQAFYEYMHREAPHLLTTEQLTEAWNAMLLSFRKESLDFLDNLKNDYRIFLLSNTNSIHKRAIDDIFKAQTGLESLDQLFEKAYYSHLSGMRKPGSEIFEYVLQDAGISAEETLFIDDLEPNITTARSLGLHVHQLLPDARIENLEYGERKW